MIVLSIPEAMMAQRSDSILTEKLTPVAGHQPRFAIATTICCNSVILEFSSILHREFHILPSRIVVQIYS